MKKVKVDIIETLDFTKEFIESCKVNGYVFDFEGYDAQKLMVCRGVDRTWFLTPTTDGRTLTIVDDFEFPDGLFDI